jgi:cytochrome b561
MVLSPGDTISAGAILLAVVAVAYGGTFLLRVHAGNPPTNDLQKAFFRAGHAHAGVLVILGLVIKILTSSEGVPPLAQQLSDAVLYAAILMPAGFFLSVTGRDPQKPNRLFILLWIGAASLTVGLISAGVGLIMAGTR